MALTRLWSRCLVGADGRPCLELEIETPLVLVSAGGAWGPLDTELMDEKRIEEDVSAVEILAPEITGKSCLDQREFDSALRKRVSSGGPRQGGELDSPEPEFRISSVAVSLISRAACVAAAHTNMLPPSAIAPTRGACPEIPTRSTSIAVAAHIARQLPGGSSGWRSSARMPVPVFTLLSGGQRAGATMPFRGVCACPAGASSLDQAVRMSVDVYHRLGALLTARYGGEATGIGDEGAYAAPLDAPDEPFAIAGEAIEAASATGRVRLWLDAGADELWDEKRAAYNLTLFDDVAGVRPLYVSAAVLCDLYCSWAKRFDLAAIQCPFAAADAEGWGLAKRLSAFGCCVVATQSSIALEASQHAGPLACVLPGVDGTLTAALDAAVELRQSRCGIVVDPGECRQVPRTVDAFAASLAVGSGAGVLKVGAPVRGECTSVVNELLRIADALQLQQQQQAGAQKQAARYAGHRLWE